jgi:hypothetical protein
MGDRLNRSQQPAFTAMPTDLAQQSRYHIVGLLKSLMGKYHDVSDETLDVEPIFITKGSLKNKFAG